MGWIKDIITDLVVTTVIIVAVIVNNEILTGVVFGYSLLMIVAKTIVYFGEQHLRMLHKVKTEAPEWISHILYAVNVAALFSFKWWFTGSIWVGIWIVSWASQRKIRSRQGK